MPPLTTAARGHVLPGVLLHVLAPGESHPRGARRIIEQPQDGPPQLAGVVGRHDAPGRSVHDVGVDDVETLTKEEPGAGDRVVRVAAQGRDHDVPQAFDGAHREATTERHKRDLALGTERVGDSVCVAVTSPDVIDLAGEVGREHHRDTQAVGGHLTAVSFSWMSAPRTMPHR